MQSFAGQPDEPSLAAASGGASAQVGGISFDRLYEEHFDFVWRSIRRMGIPVSGVDDALQDVFIVAFRRLGEFEGRASLRTWLFQIVFRVVSRHRRTARRKPLNGDDTVDDVVDSSRANPQQCAEQAEEVRLLYQLLDLLDEDKRAVFVLAELEQMSAPEIAQALDVKLNTVYSRLRAARAIVEAGAQGLQQGGGEA